MKQKADMPLRQRIDKPLVIAVIVAVTLLVAAGIPACRAVALAGDYHRFVQDLGESLLYARKHGTLELTINGETQHAEMNQVEWLYQLISDAGMGAPLKEVPDGEALAFGFGDGSALHLYPTTISEPDGTQMAGTIVSYTRTDGSTYSYDTDLFAYQDIVKKTVR